MDIKRFRPSIPVSSTETWSPVDATGGVESTITIAGTTYKLHMFTTIGTDYLKINDKGTDGQIEYLVVAGGGGGGMDMGGGGGAGGVLTGRYTVSAGENIICTVGAGGMGAPGGSQYRSDGTGPNPGGHQFTVSATSGENSVFGPYTAIGGGYGGSSYFDYTPNYGIGASGGSGGGTSGYSNGGVKAGQAGTAGQGFSGGQGGGQYYSGGGGGAGQPGTNSTAQAHGGQGLLVNILGYELYWGGGGGGAAYSLGSGGNGGLGGGGGGAIGTTYGGAGYNAGENGLGGSPNSWGNTRGGNAGTNTGGGGGAGSHYNANNNGGEGGSGIIIARYPINKPYPSYTTSRLIQSLNAGDVNSYSGSGTSWYDISGSGKTATLTNGPTFSSSNGGQIVFDGTNDYVACGNIGIWLYNGTISFWMNSTAVENYRNPFHTHFQGVNVGLRIEQNTGGGFGFLFGNDSGTYTGFTLTSSLQANTWYMVTIGWDRAANLVQAWMNGTQVVTNGANSNWATTIPSMTLGNGFDATRFFKGSIGEFYLYNSTLTNTEVVNNFNAQRGRYGV